jgi:hypothetical protein
MTPFVTRVVLVGSKESSNPDANCSRDRLKNASPLNVEIKPMNSPIGVKVPYRKPKKGCSLFVSFS